MRHQLANRDAFLAVASEGGPVSCDRYVEVDPAALAKLHYGDRSCDRFGQRRKVENRVGSHRDALGRELSVSKRAAINDLLALPDLDDGAVDSARLDFRLDDGVDLLEIRFAQAHWESGISRRGKRRDHGEQLECECRD